MRKKRTILVCITIVSLLLLGACSKKESKPAVAEPQPAEKANTVDAFGMIKAKDVQSLFLPFDASVEEVMVAEGQLVVLGDTLMTLNCTDFLAELQKKEAALDKERYSLAKLNGDTEVGDFRTYLDKQKALYEAGAISQHEYTQVRWDFEIKSREVGILALEVGRLREKLNKTFLSGHKVVCHLEKAVVYDLVYKKGDLITGDKKVLGLANLDTLYVEADINEEFVKDIKVGANVRIIPLADPARSYQGKLLRIAGMAIKKNGETVIPVEISLENKDSFLLPNYNVDVKIYRD